MSLSSYRCRIENCNFESDSNDEKIWDSHYQSEHGIAINNKCRRCGKSFVAVKRYSDPNKQAEKLRSRIICPSCSNTGVEYRNGRWYRTSEDWQKSNLSVLNILLVEEAREV